MDFLPAWSGRAVQHPDFGGDSSRDGHRKFNYAAPMSGTIELRLQRRGTRLRQYAGRRRALALCAALALALPSIAASAAAQALYTNAGDTDAGPGLASRLGDIAASVYDKAQKDVIAPSRQAAEQVLADPRTQTIYRHLSDAAQDVVALADPDVVRPVWRRSYEAVSAAARDCAERLRLWVLDPRAAGLKRLTEGEMAPPPAPDAAAPRLAVDVTADPFRQVSTIPGLPDSDILRNLDGSDPLEPFNRLMFRLNRGLQAKVLDPVSNLYLQQTSPEVQLGVGNFFRNLREPATFVSSALEGQLNDAGTAAARFGINTTLGIAGFRDPATDLGFTVRPRNFEETLCSYGVPSGPYMVLPILGPATLRDAAGRLATVVMYFEVMGAPVYV
ncbi:MAG TPA: VacJ family lipoprotein, partial [Stellaceae bacterium]